MPAPRAVEYERTPAPTVTRGHVRWFLILLTVYVLATLQSTYAPGVSASLKQWSADRQQRAAFAAAAKQAAALERQALDFLHPPRTVAWEDDPAAAAGLMAGAGYRWHQVTPIEDSPRAQHLGHWPRGAVVLPPAPMKAVGIGDGHQHNWPLGDHDAILMMHGRTDAAGRERLVIVALSGHDHLGDDNPDARFDFTSSGNEVGDWNEPWKRRVGRERALVAVAFVPGGGTRGVEMLDDRRTTLAIYPRHDPLVVDWTYTPGPPGGLGKIGIDPRPQMRFFAGQPDPKDPARFTIAYEIDGRPGTIVGRLKDDDVVELRPGTGKVVGDRWYPTGP